MSHPILLMAGRERMVLAMNMSIRVHCLTTEENMNRVNQCYHNFSILYNQYLSTDKKKRTGFFFGAYFRF